MESSDSVMSTQPQGASPQSSEVVPERLRHVFEFYGIPNLSERLSALPDAILQVLTSLPGNAARKSDLSLSVAGKSGLSEVFPRNPNLHREYMLAIHSALMHLKKQKKVTIDDDLVALHGAGSERIQPREPIIHAEHHKGVGQESTEVVTSPATRTDVLSSILSNRLPEIPDLPDPIRDETPPLDPAAVEEPLDEETKKRLRVLTDERTNSKSTSEPRGPLVSIASTPPPTDLLQQLKTMIEEELGVEVQKRLDELSIGEITPGWYCQCTISLENHGAQLALKALLPFVIDCATELLEAAEAERLYCSLGITTLHGDRMLVMRRSVDLNRYNPTEVRALSAKALQEVVKVSKIIYDSERFRHKLGKM